MRFFLFSLLLCLLIFTGCSKKPDYTDLNHIFNKYSELNQEHTALDQQYFSYFDELCTGEDIVKFDNADNIFNAIKTWKNKREKIDVKYEDIIFDESHVSVKEFKEQYIIDQLITLTRNFKAIEASADYSFLESPDCQIKYIKPDADYKVLQETRTCLISCKKLKNLAKNIKSLSEKEILLINKAKKNLQKKNYL